jgi:uncharacterized membrane protein YebE (DUF533 family)
MFDAKSLLEQVAQAASQKTGAGAQEAGGLGDLLNRVTASIGSAGSGAQGPAGGFGDILGKLQQAATDATGGTGNIGETLRQVLNQASEGAKSASADSGLTGAVRDVIGEMSGGKTPEELIGKLKTLVNDNQLAAGVIAGALGTLLVGTRGGRSLAGGIAQLGAGALIGGLAYSAYQNYRAGRPILDVAHGAPVAPAPAGSGFETQAMSNATAERLIKAMVAAAAADGTIDDTEKARILAAVTKGGTTAEAEAFLTAEMANPASAAALAAGIASEAEAVEVYTAARIAIDADTAAETAFLARLAESLKLDAALVAHVEAAARNA